MHCRDLLDAPVERLGAAYVLLWSHHQLLCATVRLKGLQLCCSSSSRSVQ
jgi:hypothetical protein